MYLLFYILLVFAIAYVLNVLFRVHFENSVIIGQGSIIGFLYVFYLLNYLELGIWVVVFLLVGLFAYSIYVSLKRKEITRIVRNVCNYTFCGYFIYLVFSFFTIKDKVPFWGDELRYWAAVPKILYRYHGALQLNNGFQIFSVDYIPGISIYQFFLEYLNGIWSDSLLFFSYAAITGALILPVGKKVTSWKEMIGLSVLLYFTPLFFFHTKVNDYAVVYQSLYVDPMVGVAAGMVVWLCIGKPWKKKEDFAAYVSVGTFLALVKSSGIAFVIIAAVAMIICIIISGEISYFRKIWFWIGVFLPIFLWELWNIALKYYQIRKELNYSLSALFNIDFVGTFIEALIKKKVLTVWIYPITEVFSFAVCFILLTALIVFLEVIIRQNGNGESTRKVVIIMLYIQVIVYVVGLYALCVGTFGGRLNSFQRYISTVLEMMACFLCCELFIKWRDIYKFLIEHKDRINWIIVTGVAALIFVVIAPLRYVNNTANTYPDYIIEDRLAISSAFEKISDTIPEEGWKSVVLFFDEPTWESVSWVSWAKQWYGHLLNNVSYESIKYGVQIRQVSYYDSEMEKNEADGKIICTLTNDRNWVDVDYVCMCHGNYVETPIHHWELYKVEKIDGKQMYLELVYKDDKPEGFVNYHVEG